MKISIGATIPTMQYGNITPSIEISDINENPEDLEKARKLALRFISDLYAKYSSGGELKENKIKTSVDKINDLKL